MDCSQDNYTVAIKDLERSDVSFLLARSSDFFEKRPMTKTLPWCQKGFARDPQKPAYHLRKRKGLKVPSLHWEFTTCMNKHRERSTTNNTRHPLSDTNWEILRLQHPLTHSLSWRGGNMGWQS
ncbi:hypothetical protein K503DRAFT_509636 [Rhizopogon vinicolor AM-OR11-026]|uniref:Uncharacterized protein n=1 Tax=Rhizopogon vinicolor AM-OR11-026 TaxID=1314800 RepID=A0A1B7MLZ2_9AGAM|nr:hypothetical protein K503DRAFT_509636 [Rhizopogon vinicolor AM-OR11-026]